MTAAMVRISPLAVVYGPYEGPSGRVIVNGIRVDSPPIGWSDGEFKLCSVTYAGNQPTEFHSLNNEALSVNGDILTITRTWTPPTLAAAKALLKSRLEQQATQRWYAARGTNSAAIELAVSDGRSAVDAAASLVSALAAFNAVVWP